MMGSMATTRDLKGRRDGGTPVIFAHARRAGDSGFSIVRDFPLRRFYLAVFGAGSAPCRSQRADCEGMSTKQGKGSASIMMEIPWSKAAESQCSPAAFCCTRTQLGKFPSPANEDGAWIVWWVREVGIWGCWFKTQPRIKRRVIRCFPSGGSSRFEGRGNERVTGRFKR